MRIALVTSSMLVILSAAAMLGAVRLGLGDMNNPGSGLLPFGTAALLGLMALGQLAVSTLRAAPPSGNVQPDATARGRWPVLAVALATVLASGLLLDRLGFTLTALLMLLVLFGVVGRKRWWVALTLSLVSVAAVSLLFGSIGLRLPPGPFGF